MFRKLCLTLLTLALLLIAPRVVLAHCDGLDGPVVKAAMKALDSGDVSLVLVWVPAKDEAAIEVAFAKTREVRALGPAAREFADMYFFETVVRVHRLAEGAPYTGLKPAGRNLGPAIPAADRALETGSSDALLSLILTAVMSGLIDEYDRAMEAKHASRVSVEAGREYVERYVAFIHYVERLYEAARTAAPGHAAR